jgi:hypothetical protein
MVRQVQCRAGHHQADQLCDTQGEKTAPTWAPVKANVSTVKISNLAKTVRGTTPGQLDENPIAHHPRRHPGAEVPGPLAATLMTRRPFACPLMPAASRPDFEAAWNYGAREPSTGCRDFFTNI